MATKLTDDVNVVSNSDIEITYLNGDLNIIQKLDDEPNDVGGLTADELKAKFDEAGNIIKNFINESLIPEILAEEAVEHVREANEAQREANEESRESNEIERINNESARVSAELERDAAERDRAGAETSRVNAESNRVSEENLRENAEQNRVDAEAARANNEAQRIANEELRQDLEKGYVAQAAKSAEDAKASEAAAQAAQVAAEAAADRAESVGSGGVSSWNDLTDKPFGEENYEEEFTGYSSSSTLSFEVPALSESKKCYKMFNLALSYKDLLGTKIGFLRSPDTAMYTGTPTEKDFIANDENISAFTVVLKNVLDSTRTVSETFLVARKAGEVETELGVLNIPIVGTYLLYGESIPVLRVVSMSGVRIKTLDEKYLPEMGAEGVKFTKDLTTTYEIGNITLENGRAVIPAAGKSIREVWDTIFVTELPPTVTEPKVTLGAQKFKAYEVGEKVRPTYNAELSAGAYSYGPDTGITASAWSVKDTKGGEITTAIGAFTEFTVRDDTDYSITAVATHGAGAVPLTNLGNEYPDGQIAAGTKQATSTAITGYRNGFYGTADTKDAAIDSAFVRGLASKSGKTPAAGNVWNLDIPVGAMRIAFAYPATIRDVSSVLDVNGMSAEIKTAFTKYTVSVEGANGYTGIDYKVYVLDRAAAVTEANTFKITI